MKFLRHFLLLLFITMNNMLLQASFEREDQIKKNDENGIKYEQPFFENEKEAEIIQAFLPLHNSNSEQLSVSNVSKTKQLACKENAEQIKNSSECFIFHDSQAADAWLLNLINNTTFNEVGVQKILATYPYLTAAELHIELQRREHKEVCRIDDSIQISANQREAVARKSMQETAGIVDTRPLVDRMIAHANLDEAQKNKVEEYKNLSLQEIENMIKSANFRLEDVDSKLTTKVTQEISLSGIDEEIGLQDRDSYFLICREIYKSKKIAQIIETYKDFTIEEMCDHVNELYKGAPCSEFLREIYQDAMIPKMFALIGEYAAQHDGTVDIEDFVEGRKSLAAAAKLTKSDESSKV